jgi:Fe-S-cluster containining protein
LKNRLSSQSPGCLFLDDDGSCIIHAVRPAACRQFNVMGSPCKEGEDAFFTRRADVITPIRDYTERAFIKMLPFYRLQDAADSRGAANMIIERLMVSLKEHKWDGLAGLLK